MYDSQLVMVDQNRSLLMIREVNENNKRCVATRIRWLVNPQFFRYILWLIAAPEFCIHFTTVLKKKFDLENVICFLKNFYILLSFF